MILIIGGFCQGKTEYMKQIPEYKEMTSGVGILEYADGRTDSLEQAVRCPVILGFHHYIKRISPDEQAVEALIDRIVTENPKVLITMDEVGGGIVPVDPEDRVYRELVGRAGQRLAREASQVHRVLCGLGMIIKNENTMGSCL